MKTQFARLRSTASLLLALLVLATLPSPAARASQGQCGDVNFYPEYVSGTQIRVVLEVGNGCDIYLTSSLDNPSFPDPSRSGVTPISPTIKVSSGASIYVPFGHTMYFKAFAYKALWTQSVNLGYWEQHNPEDP